jgi:hypothetical protein
MAWGNHKEADCQLGKERMKEQNNSINQVPAQAALATVLKPSWPIWHATWLMIDWPDLHGNHGQRSG